MSLPKSSENSSKILTHSITNGQALLGVLIAIAIFAILSHTLFTLIGSSYNLVSYNRARITAKHLAQENMEIIRNIPYESLGTEGGIPTGLLPQETTVEKNGLEFTVKTNIIYINDPFNGTNPEDTDYKKVSVEVSWGGVAQSRKNPVTLVSDFAPKLVTEGEGGTLKILVLDANGNRLSGAQVHIAASTLTPVVDLTQTTGSNGEITLPGAQPCSNCYEITVTKSGYSTDKTNSTDEVFNPNKPHASLIDGQLTQVSFTIDTLANLEINSVDSRENEFTSLGNLPFNIRGNKQIGTDETGLPVYKYDNNFTTNAEGQYQLSDLEWDVYSITMPETTTYSIAGSQPLLPINLMPGNSITLTFTIKPYTTHNLLVITKDPSQNLLENVYLRLYDGLGFETATQSGSSANPDFGQNLFSDLNEEVVYFLEATASGYLDKTQNAYVYGYTVDEIILTPE